MRLGKKVCLGARMGPGVRVVLGIRMGLLVKVRLKLRIRSGVMVVLERGEDESKVNGKDEGEVLDEGGVSVD